MGTMKNKPSQRFSASSAVKGSKKAPIEALVWGETSLTMGEVFNPGSPPPQRRTRVAAADNGVPRFVPNTREIIDLEGDWWRGGQNVATKSNQSPKRKKEYTNTNDIFDF